MLNQPIQAQVNEMEDLSEELSDDAMDRDPKPSICSCCGLPCKIDRIED